MLAYMHTPPPCPCTRPCQRPSRRYTLRDDVSDVIHNSPCNQHSALLLSQNRMLAHKLIFFSSVTYNFIPYEYISRGVKPNSKDTKTVFSYSAKHPNGILRIKNFHAWNVAARIKTWNMPDLRSNISWIAQTSTKCQTFFLWMSR